MTMIILIMFRFNLFVYIFAYDDDDDLDRTFEALTGVTEDFFIMTMRMILIIVSVMIILLIPITLCSGCVLSDVSVNEVWGRLCTDSWGSLVSY